MSYLLFMDESGHDHKIMPYEVRGGICVHSRRVAPLLKDIEKLELRIFGCHLSEFQTEIKGSKLLNAERFRWANQGTRLPEQERQKGCRRFLTAHLEHRAPTRTDFTAYGQACIQMVDAILELLAKYKVQIIASCIKKGVQKPKSFEFEHFLRKDHQYLLERFACLLKKCKEDGIIIMDQVEKVIDKKFSRQVKSFLSYSNFGITLRSHIVPEPLFIESDISSLIQIADICIYIINTGYRKSKSMTESARLEIQQAFEDKIAKLELHYQQRKYRNGKRISCPIYGITFTPRPYTEQKGRGNAVRATISNPSAEPL